MRSNTVYLHRALRGAVALTLGGLTAFVELLSLLLVTPAHVVPAARERVEAVGRALVDLNRRRLVAYLAFDDLLCVPPDWHRGQSFLVRRMVVGMMGLVILALIGLGSVSAAIMGWQVLSGRPVGGGSESNSWFEVVTVVGVGFILVFGAVWALIG